MLTLRSSLGSDYGFSFLPVCVACRPQIAIQLVFAITIAIIVWGLPESPCWLAKRDREEEAVEALCALFDLEKDDPYVVGEIEAIHVAIAIDIGEGAQKVLALFKLDKL